MFSTKRTNKDRAIYQKNTEGGKTAIVHVFLPLIIGLTLYALNGKTQFSTAILLLPNWCFYNLPDGLWGYAFISAMAVIWQLNKAAKWWIGIAFLLSLGWELAQKFHWVSGTFDVLDVWILLIFNTLATIRWYFSSSKS